MKNSDMPRIHVLSLDGGGILGIVYLRILHHIEQEMGRPICSLFRLISGVSTGGIITLGLTIPEGQSGRPLYSAEKLLDLYKTQSHLIFQRTRLGRLSCRLAITEYLHSLFFSKYSAYGAEKVFSALLGDKCLSHALTDILIPAYNIQGSFQKEPRLKLFSSHKVKRKLALYGHGDFLMREVALATSAAPTYFPPRHVGTLASSLLPDYHLIDGGVAINDPSLLAYAEARARYPNHPLYILSLGIGQNVYGYEGLKGHQSPGVLAWHRKLPHLIVGPQLSIYRTILRRILRHYDAQSIYHRIQPDHAHHFSHFDDISPHHLTFLEHKAAEVIRDRKPQLDELILSLKNGL